jgi:hypothetical protein
LHTDRCGNTCRQKCCAELSGEAGKMHVFIYKDTTYVEPGRKIIPVITGAIGIVTKGLKEKLEAIPGKQSWI